MEDIIPIQLLYPIIIGYPPKSVQVAKPDARAASAAAEVHRPSTRPAWNRVDQRQTLSKHGEYHGQNQKG